MQPEHNLRASFYQPRWSLVQSASPKKIAVEVENSSRGENYLETHCNHFTDIVTSNSLYSVLPNAQPLDKPAKANDVDGGRNAASSAGTDSGRDPRSGSNQVSDQIHLPAGRRVEQYRRRG